MKTTEILQAEMDLAVEAFKKKLRKNWRECSDADFTKSKANAIAAYGAYWAAVDGSQARLVK